MSKLLSNVLKFSGGGWQMPQTPHPWLRLLVNERLAVAKGKAYAVLS